MILFFLSIPIILKKGFKDVKLQRQKNGFNNASLSYKNVTQYRKKSPVEDEEIGIIGTRPPISRFFSPIDRNIAFAQTKRLSDR